MVKNLTANAGDTRDMDSKPGSGRSPGVGNGNPLQYYCLENPMDRGAWWAAIHGVAKNRTRLNTRARAHTHTHTHTHTTNFKVKLAATSESGISDYQLSGVSTIILYFPKAKEKEMNSVNQLF